MVLSIQWTVTAPVPAWQLAIYNFRYIFFQLSQMVILWYKYVSSMKGYI